ncbi:adhesion exoprotein [Secundilactobacillus pentosiphilus]|uniref:Adhesion exoprotein n=1 Tax=Secundilactobacillus pentosiphilus TaxID=1714682 RepID=A0A1Z5ILC2_9LACO|nr:MBG domain-containing protein [Secundilactobacillus pentosiphilus]GAX02506.1 adhesion exoprotein [Secundilactobacillus pentosiphilus]
MKRYRYDQIEKAEPNVTRYKLYKAKTKWVIRGVSSVAILFGIHEMGVNGVPQIVNPLTTTAHADTVADNSTSDLNALTDAGTTATDSNTAQATNSPVATTVATPVNPLLGVQNEGVNEVSQIVNPLPEAGLNPAASKSNDGAAATSDQSTGVANTPANNGAAASSDNQAASANENAASTDSQQASDANGSQNATSAKQVTDAEEFAANQKLDAKNEKLNKANVSQNATQEAKKVADAPYDAEKASVQQSAQSVLNDLQKVADEANKQAAANDQDRDVNDAAYSALQEHMAQEVNQINVALTAQSDTLPKDMTTEALGLTQANKILTNMRQELDVAKQMMAADRAGYDAQLVESAQSALKQVVLPSGTNAELDAYGDLIVSASNSTAYQSVVNQLQQSGLISNFRYVVDPTTLDDGTSDYTAAQALDSAKDAALNSALKTISSDLTMTTDPATFKSSPLYDQSNITNYNIFAPYIKNLQDVFNNSKSTPKEIVQAAALVQGAYNAYMNYNGGLIPKDDDQQQSSKNISIALVLNVDENGNPIFITNYGTTIKAGDILNSVGRVVDPTTGLMTHEFLSPVGDPSAVNDGTYYVGTIGNAIPNPSKDIKIPNFTYVSTEGPTKLESIAGGKTMQVVINHWTSGSKPTTPTTTALKATVGDVSKTFDGNTMFTTVPTVQLSGLTGVKTPTFVASDFDWSKVQAAAGTYAVTLNAAGIKKVTDANANTTLTAANITAGKAIIKPAAPKITALKAIVGDVSKTYDGNTTFTTVPTVQLSGLTGVKTPTFATTDFDWSKVQAAAGTYAVTLNATGIKKVTDANANTTLVAADITAGKATIKPAAPKITALKAIVGDVSKTFDGNATFTTVPAVQLSGLTGVKTPTFATTDFDWSKVQAAAGTYAVTLNAAGIKKVTDANANTTLAVADVTAGKATIKPAAPTTKALTATVGPVTKTYDGTPTFSNLPSVTLSDNATVPTLTATDFDWSKVSKNAGTYSVTLNAAGIKKITDANANTSLATSAITAGKVLINKAPITITVTSQTKKQGDPDPELSILFTNTPSNGDKLAYTTNREPGEEPGTYAIKVVASATDNPNYDLTIHNGTLTITAKVTALKAAVGNVSKTFDGTTTFTTLPKVTLSGLTNATVPTFTASDFDWSNVQPAAGTYSVTLNAGGIKKVTDANTNTTLTAADVTAGNATINPAAPTVTALKAKVGDVSKNYDGNTTFTTVPSVQLTGLTGVKTPTFVTTDFDWSQVQATAGTYAVTLNAVGIKKVTDANANTTLAATDVTVGKATINPAPIITALRAKVGDVSKTYDGNTTFTTVPTVTLSGLSTAVDPSFTASDFDWSNVQVAAGTYSVTLNAAGIKKVTDANANTTLAAADVTAGKATINPETPTITALKAKVGDVSKTYDGNTTFTTVPTVNISGLSNAVVPSFTASDFDWSNVQAAAGTYSVTLNAAGIKKVTDANANTTLATTDVTAGKATINPVVLKAKVGDVSKTYDGNTTFTSVPTVTLSGLTNAVDPSFTASDFDWSKVQAAAGTYSVTLNAAGIKKVIDANANTTLTSADVTAGKATINPVAPTITALKATVGNVSKTYDGNATFTTLPTVNLSGLTNAVIPVFTTSDFDWSKVQAATGTYAITLNAAGIKKVTDANANTTLATADVTAGKATINPVTTTALTAKVGDVSKAYDGTATFTTVPTVSLGGLAGAVVPTFTTSDFDWSNVQPTAGSYSVTLNAAGIKKVTDANANTTLAATDVTAGKATINPASPTIRALKAKVGDVSKTYDGTKTFTTMPKVTLSDLTNATVPTFTATDFDWSNVQPAVGNYSVTLNAAGIKKITDANANTTLTAADVTAGKATINPVVLKAKVANTSKTYDGTKTFTTMPAVTLTGITNATVPTFTATDFDWSNVQPAVGSYSVTLNAAGIKKVTDANANTALAATDVTAGKATITPAALTAKVDDVSKNYDGTATFTTVPTVTLSGLTTTTVPTLTTSDFDWSNVKPDAGSYSVTLNAAGIKKITDANANTTLTAADVTAGKATINPVVLKAKVANTSKTYDGTKTFTTMPAVTLTGVTNATVPTFTATDFDWSNVQPAVGSYSVTLNAAGIKKITDANANTALAATDVTAGKATITPAALTAKVDDVSKNYDGTATFTTMPTVTLSGLTTTTVPTLTTSDFDWSNVKPDAGSYSVTLNAAGIKKITDANANTTLAATGVTAGKAVINKAAVTVTANNVSKLAGDADPALTATVAGNPANGDQVKYTVSRDAGEAVGTYTIHVTANAADNPNYTITAKTGQFTIAKVAAKATVHDVSKTYDGTTTFNKGPVVSLDHGFTASDLTNADFDWSQVQANVGTYSVMLNAAGIQKLLSDNPDMTLTAADVTAGQVTIKKATVTVTANDASKVAGDADPALTARVDKPAKGADVNYKVSRAAGENVGTYAITVTPTTNLNYNVEVKPGQFTITPQPADVAVGNVTKAYDGTTSFTDVPAITVTGAKDVKLPTLTASDFDWSNVQENVGSYQVSLNDAGKAKLQQLNPNISISKVTAGTATITPAKVTLQAKNATKVFGTNDPAFDATVTGQPAKGAKVAYKITRAAGENVGSYDLTVTPTAESNSNYQVTVTKGGQLTVTPAATSAVISTVHKTYDGTTAKPEQTLTVTLANGTMIDNLPTSDFDWSAVGANAGDYAVSLNAQGLQAIEQQQPNYTLTTKDVQAGHVIVDPAPVTITAPTITKDYDKQGYTGDLKATVTGQPADGADLKYSLTDLSNDANIGVYPINVILGTNSNYDVKITTGKLTVKANNFALTTNYVDAKNNQLAAPTSTKNHNLGDAYKTEAKAITGYYLTAEPANAAGTFAGNTTVNYVYAPLGSAIITMPNGEQTKIAYKVDGTDLTKVSVQTGQVVPYVKGYTAFAVNGGAKTALTPVNAKDVTAGYQLPALPKDPSQDTVITYVAETSTNGGNVTGGTTSGEPTGNGATTNTGTTPTGSSENQNGTLPTVKTDNQSGETETMPNSTNNANGSTSEPGSQSTGTTETMGASQNAGQATNGVAANEAQGTTENANVAANNQQAPSVSGNASANSQQVAPKAVNTVANTNKGEATQQKIAKKTLPQTGETAKPSFASEVGVMLLGLFGLFGTSKKKRHE